MTGHMFLAITAASLVAILIRIVPVLFFANRTFPAILRNWLSFVPVAILSALVAGQIIGDKSFTSFGVSVALLATLAATLAGLLSRSLLGTVLAAVLAYLLFQNL
ncbi:MAG: Azaleucine resistance protein AzlD [Candidatus Tokpelaia hoelldobleri]|uniref:Azaleucine resistance protein AzlD n=1 Tax=Candidatus Tokpelaia hoelldobleri TaxID=1902579 RepID=A0A1U9JU42_9HYPH|nr:MAG: Azaleucine resistance protein AzlD [Candidatus Tokpelaia hoelldoblerii]